MGTLTDLIQLPGTHILKKIDNGIALENIDLGEEGIQLTCKPQKFLLGQMLLPCFSEKPVGGSKFLCDPHNRNRQQCKTISFHLASLVLGCLRKNILTGGLEWKEDDGRQECGEQEHSHFHRSSAWSSKSTKYYL